MLTGVTEHQYFCHDAVPTLLGKHLVTVSEVAKKLLLGFHVPSAKPALPLPSLSLWTGSFAGSAAEALSLMDVFEHHHIINSSV